jgi:hypothetical protein
LSAFMQGEVTRKAQEYMEEGIVTYLNSCKWVANRIQFQKLMILGKVVFEAS